MLENESIQIDVFKLLNIYKRNFILILIVTILGGFLGGIFRYFFIDDKYESTAIIYLSPNEPEFQKILLTSHTILDNVIENNDLNLSSQKLLKILEINNLNNDRLVSVSVETSDSNLSKKIVNAIVDETNTCMYETFKIEKFIVLEYGTISSEKSNMSIIYIVLLSSMLSCIMVLLYLFFDMTLNEKIESKYDAEKFLEINVWSEIPKYKKIKK